MQECLVHAGVIGDILHARAVDAAADKDLVGGVEDTLLRIRFGLSRRFNHLVKEGRFTAPRLPCCP